MQSKLLVPVALGLSLVTVSALVVYYVFKKDEEDEDNKRVKTSRMNVIEVSVPKSIVAALIGRGGSNIKEIERTTGAKVNVKEFSGKDHDICVIRGRTEATQIAETLIHDFINQQPVNVEDTMDVPVWAVGRIIGSQGDNVTSISHRSGAKIKVEKNDRGAERKINFLGTKEQIKIAKDLIENCVAQEKCRREIEQSKRSPRHVQSASKSPSPTPSVATSDNTEDASGDSQVHRHAKYKRPAPENGSTNATDWLVRATRSRSGSGVQQRQDEERTTTQQLKETCRFRFRSFFIIFDKCYYYYGYFTGFVSLTWSKPVEVEPVEEPTRTTPKLPKRENVTVPKQPRPTRADKGEVTPPSLRIPTCVADHVHNALLEYLAIVTATRQVNLMQCHKIWQAYNFRNERLLQVLLDEAEGAIYDNNTHQVIRGEMTGTYMAAYSATGNFVAHDEDKSSRSGKITFAAPEYNPIVVTAKCTKIMLDDKILEMAQTIQGRTLDWRSEIYGVPVQRWPQQVPKIKWINGVPGCGKTTWVVQHFEEDKDVVATTTIEAAKDLKEKLVCRLGDRVKNKVRTMASILANGFKEQYYRLTVDEALMNHFGSIIMAARLAGVSEIVLIGDVNQLPFLDRENLFQLWYTRPTLVASITQKLLCTRRNPMDVAFALSDVYSGIYSAKQQIRSLKVKRYTGALIPRTSAKTLYLVHTQKEKKSLLSQGYGSGDGSRTLTIHEAQGLTCENVVIINTKSKRLQLHDSIPHAIVAVSRHTVSCVYYTDHACDAIALFARRAMDAPSITIVDYNLKMALQQRDHAVAAYLLNISKAVSAERNQKNSVRSYIFENRGTPIEVYVSAVSSPSRFWVQFVGPQVTQLDSLVEEMTEYYGKKENREAHALAHVSIGQVVAAVFRHDGRWYRARVHDIRANEFDATQQVADVFFLDYGDSEYVATHELCELRADLLRLRFQAMECFLAGVRPAVTDEIPRDRWHPQAIERFEELTQVARWKPLLSKTCTYKKTATAEGEKEKEIPGIKLYDNTDEGEVDIGAALIAEGWAEHGPGDRPSPTQHKPFGDLGNSRVLGMLDEGRSSSLPKDHKDDRGDQKQKTTDDSEKDNDRMTTSKSLGSGLETGDKPLSISNFDLSYPDNSLSKALNGSHENFLHMEKQTLDKEGNVETGSIDTLVPPVPSTPIQAKSALDEFKANMNRIDSHHNLEFLTRSQHEN